MSSQEATTANRIKDYRAKQAEKMKPKFQEFARETRPQSRVSVRKSKSKKVDDLESIGSRSFGSKVRSQIEKAPKETKKSKSPAEANASPRKKTPVRLNGEGPQSTFVKGEPACG